MSIHTVKNFNKNTKTYEITTVEFLEADVIADLIKEDVVAGNKISAIKELRDTCHVGLKDSKDVVEDVMADYEFSRGVVYKRRV